jgi:hypothetical protein
MPNPYCFTTLLYLEICANNQLYGLFCTAQKQQAKLLNMPRKSCQRLPRFAFPLSLVRIVRIHTIWPPTTEKQLSNETNMLPWDLCPLFHGKCVHYAALNFLSRAYSKIYLNILLLCLAHYPMHSFINLKVSFHLPQP